MSIRETDLRAVVSEPSLGAATYQARVLVHELQRFSEDDYPEEACRVRDVLLCVADYLFAELLQLRNEKNPFRIKGGVEGHERLIALARAVHKLHAFLRYILASSPRQSPPAIQIALAQLLDLYFPKKRNGIPVCVVRPQWKYNLQYVALYEELSKLLLPSFVDPNAEHGADIIRTLWKRWRKTTSREQRKSIPTEPPEQLAILSFAGLDTHDALLYPLLAHELAHFIDHSFTPQLSLHPLIKEASRIDPEDVRKILQEFKTVPLDDAKKISNILYDVALNSIKELTADLLAVRMLGFSYFVSLAELLKTTSSWPDRQIHRSHPGIKYRLQTIYEHLTDPTFPGNPLQFFEQKSASFPTLAKPLSAFLKHWEGRLSFIPEDNAGMELSDRLMVLAEQAVERSRGTIIEVIRKEGIDDRNCVRLSERFFERISHLEKELPPCFRDEDRKCFAEIMSASWAYQILFGEARENKISHIDGRLAEYRKTCRLVLKAIELIPLSVSNRSARRPSRAGLEAPDSSGSKLQNQEWLLKVGVLSAPFIRQRVQLPIDDPAHLGIVPLDLKKVQAASIDVHLGNWFAVSKRPKLRSGKKTHQKTSWEEIFVPFRQKFIIHPGDLVISSTLEFISLPADLMAFVEARSTLGRQGLFISTAAAIAPGFHGVVVLELANTGGVPLELSPGDPIAQIMFQRMTEPLPDNELYKGQFYCQIKP